MILLSNGLDVLHQVAVLFLRLSQIKLQEMIFFLQTLILRFQTSIFGQGYEVRVEGGEGSAKEVTRVTRCGHD